MMKKFATAVSVNTLLARSAALLSALLNVELIGEAKTGEEAIVLAETLPPDVILMDLQMPGGGGLPAIRQIVQKRIKDWGRGL